MYRMYGMSRCHGWQGTTHVQDVRYSAWSYGRRCGSFSCHLDQRERSFTLAIKISPVGRDDRSGAYLRIFHVGELSEVTRLWFNSHAKASSAS